MTRTVAGVALVQTADGGWAGVVDGVGWVFVARSRYTNGGRPSLGWGGFTEGHQTGLPPQRTLRRAVAWIRAHRVEIAEKVATRAAR